MSEQLDLPKFVVEVESAFLLVGGEKSKAIYDWMIASQERERIIKLLETDKTERQPVCSDADCEKCPAFERGFDRAIALIKGEQK